MYLVCFACVVVWCAFCLVFSSSATYIYHDALQLVVQGPRRSSACGSRSENMCACMSAMYAMRVTQVMCDPPAFVDPQPRICVVFVCVCGERFVSVSARATIGASSTTTLFSLWCQVLRPTLRRALGLPVRALRCSLARFTTTLFSLWCNVIHRME